MRTGLYAFAAAVIFAATLPAAAQDFRVRAGENGVGIRVGGDHEDGGVAREAGAKGAATIAARSS